MIDKITIQRIDTLSPFVLPEVKNHIYPEIVEALTGSAICRFARCYTTNAEQDKIYAQGRTLPGKIVTYAKGGESYHNYGLAADIVLLKDKDGNGTFETASWETNVDFDGDGVNDWIEVVRIFKKYGWEAGIDWKFRDPPHFQKTLGYTIAQLQKISPNRVLRNADFA